MKPLVVQKFGGTSVGTVERIKNVAKRVKRTVEEGNRVVVAVSAMSGETDKLLKLCNEVAANLDPRECDQVVATGEQVTIGLLAMALKDIGQDAVSFLGSQVAVVTDDAFMKARIKRIDGEKIFAQLDQGRVVIVAGFQGVDEQGNVTTLGRGGSDTTGVALAAALKADVCEIYTDVLGVYTTDPNIVPEAQLLPKMSYEEMLELASLGAKVLALRSVEFAAKYNVKVHVRSTFSDAPGTIVCKEDSEMESAVVSGITYNKNESKILVKGVPDRPGVAAALLAPIAKGNIVVDMIVQNIGAQGHTDFTFTVPKADSKKALEIVERTAKELGAAGVEHDTGVAKVSIVGVGMKSHAGVATTMFETLAKEGINIQMISTSEIKVSVVIADKYTELAVRALHAAFELDKPRTGVSEA
jgi:aspartate kinase